MTEKNKGKGENRKKSRGAESDQKRIEEKRRDLARVDDMKKGALLESKVMEKLIRK